jgi:hypothetical protein
MTAVLDDLNRVEERLAARIRELEAQMDELDELRRLADRLGLDVPSRRPARPARSRGHATGGRSTGSKRTGRPTRRDRVLELVRERPGITVPELVEEMKVNRTSLYPVVRQLVSDGLIEKSGAQLRATH